RRGGRAVAWRDDLQLAVVERHDEPGRGALLAGRRLQHLVFGLVQINRTRVEPGQHPGDRGLDQLVVADRLDRILADTLERLAEQIELLVDAALAGFLLRQGRRRYQKNDQPRSEERR